MVITFETQPDRQRLAAALRRAFRHSLRMLVLAGVLLLVPATIDLLDDRPLRAVGWVVGAVILLVSPLLVVRSAVQTNWKTYGVPIAWQFSDEGLRMSSPLMESLIRWPALEAVERIPDQLLLKINRQQVVPVPITGLTPHEQDTLFDFLRGRGLLPAARFDAISSSS